MPLLLLAATAPERASAGWSCFAGPGAADWLCADQDTSTPAETPPSRPPPAGPASSTKPKAESAVRTFAEKPPGAERAGGANTDAAPAGNASSAAKARTSAPTRQSEPGKEVATSEPDKQTAKRADRPDKVATAKPASRSEPEAAIETARLHEGLPWDYCGPRPARLGPSALPPQPNEQDLLYVSADDFAYDQERETLSLSGDVEINQGSRKLQANQITYYRNSGDVRATGNAFLANPGVRLIGSKMGMNLDTDRGTMWDAHYRLTGPINARGTAERADLLSPTLTKYEDFTYTTCPPGQNAWSLQANKLEIDQEEGMGVARHAKVRVKGVPVLYTPYISFPIDDRRKSGFLVPTIGSSEETGFDLTTPYYYNIAPNMDATFFPRYMSKRGALLGTEFRFLTAKQRGEIYGEVIPSDSQYEDGAARGAMRLEYSGSYGSRWSSYINFNAVSDDEYLEDFGNRLEITSARNIERRADLIYSGTGWSLLTRLQDFQTVDAGLPSSSHPYARLPQLLFSMNPRRLGKGIELGVGGDYNYFDQSTRVHGHRLALQPYVRWPLRRPYGHLIPRANLYLSAYDLQNPEPEDPKSPSHAIPSVNLDGKLVFERKVRWLGEPSMQTLEPRLFYLYTPFRNQEQTPVFDSSELTFSYSSLFRQNRFTGRDRIGDANQLTLGLTSRTLSDASGDELFRASVGETLYFRDREVQIAGPPEDQGSSALAGEFSARFLPHWTGRASFQWDPNDAQERWDKRALELHYQTPGNRLVNFAYRYDRGATEETRYEDADVTVRWPINRKLELVGRWYYSLFYEQTQEAFAGVEYGECCWRMRLLGRHFKNKPDSQGNTAIMVQVELAGLASIGHKVDKFLERGIYGYEAD